MRSLPVLFLLAACGGSGSDLTLDTSTLGSTGSTTTPAPECSAKALELIDLVNEYRAENGLPAIPSSLALCIVADTHVVDLQDNGPDVGDCNMHSWSDQGSWSPCCYTDDHAEAECMWDKPRELTWYPGNGYENAAWGSTTPESALSGWKGSPGHNAVILNESPWNTITWQAIGAGFYGDYAVLWFGEEADNGPGAPI